MSSPIINPIISSKDVSKWGALEWEAFVQTLRDSQTRLDTFAGFLGDVTYSDFWMQDLSPSQLYKVMQMAEAMGEELNDTTVLEPYYGSTDPISYALGDNTRPVATIREDPSYYLERVTATIRGLKFNNGMEPDPYFAGSNMVDPMDYVKASIHLTSKENTMSRPIPLSHWARLTDNSFLVGILPYVPRTQKVSIKFEIMPEVASIAELSVTFHERQFPRR